jgi:hypothetical protein
MEKGVPEKFMIEQAGKIKNYYSEHLSYLVAH